LVKIHSPVGIVASAISYNLALVQIPEVRLQTSCKKNR
jgi:hypothetical protein